MSLATLTAYPNVDLDPKNTQWIHIAGNDERNVMFHWMKDMPDPDRPETFGGYIVFYVAGQLVTGNQQGGEVSLYVEVKGDYVFLQPNPAFQVSSGQFAGPLPEAALRNLGLAAGCDDGTAGSTTHSGIQILANSTRSLPSGFLNGYGYNGTTPLEYSPGTTWDPRFAAAYRATANRGFLPSPNATGAFSTQKDGAAYSLNLAMQVTRNLPLPVTNAEKEAYWMPAPYNPPTFVPAPAPNPGYYYAISGDKQLLSGIFFRCQRASWNTLDATDWLANTSAAPFIMGAPSQIGNPIKIADTLLPDFSKPARSDESFVVFVNTFLRTMNYQTHLMAEGLRQSKAVSTSNTYVYTLRSAVDDAPIINMRLWPDGQWSTNAVTVDTLIIKPGEELYLTYDRILPVSSPLPPVAYALRKALKDYRKCQMRETTESRLKAFSAL